MYHIDSSYTLESFHIGVDLQHTEWKVCEWWRKLFSLNVHLLKSATNYELWHNPCTMSLQAFIWYPYWLSIVLLYSHFRLHDNAVCIANNKIQNFLLAQSDKMWFKRSQSLQWTFNPRYELKVHFILAVFAANKQLNYAVICQPMLRIVIPYCKLSVYAVIWQSLWTKIDDFDYFVCLLWFDLWYLNEDAPLHDKTVIPLFTDWVGLIFDAIKYFPFYLECVVIELFWLSFQLYKSTNWFLLYGLNLQGTSILEISTRHTK